MSRLFHTAFRSKKYAFLRFCALLAMCLLTIASQLEIIAIGIITKQGSNVINFLNINKILPLSDNLQNLAFFLVFVALFKALTLFAQRFSTRLIAIRVSKDLRQDYFNHIQLLPMSFYQKHNIGSLSSRVVGDAALIAEAVNSCLINYVQTPFTIISTLVFCFIISWQLSLLVFLGLPLIILPIIFLARRVKRISKQIQHNQEGFVSVLLDFLNGIQTVKVFAMEGFSQKKYAERNELMAALEQKSARYDLASRPIVHTIGMTFLALTLMYGLYFLNMNISELLVYCGFLYLFYEPVKKFAEENTHIQRGISAAERMYDVMNMRPQIEDSPSATAIHHFKKTIDFENVWFRYEDQWVLKGLSFTVEKGQTVAIVGPTGAGKSTIVQLLPRLYEVEKGEIRIDGRSIKDYTQSSLRSIISFVPQRPFLFLDTIAQNIAYGQPFSPVQIQAAARKAHAEEFIMQLPKGYEFELSENGKNLSGGQQQRLAIARALVKDAPILVMDEATSSLDSVSENYIKMALNTLKGEVTQIIIAHRLSTIEHADKIIYLEEGMKTAEGNKDQLLKSCEGFRNMWNLMHKNLSQ